MEKNKLNILNKIFLKIKLDKIFQKWYIYIEG